MSEVVVVLGGGGGGGSSGSQVSCLMLASLFTRLNADGHPHIFINNI